MRYARPLPDTSSHGTTLVNTRAEVESESCLGPRVFPHLPFARDAHHTGVDRPGGTNVVPKPCSPGKQAPVLARFRLTPTTALIMTAKRPAALFLRDRAHLGGVGRLPPQRAARRAPTSAETEWARGLLATESASPDTAAGLPRRPRQAGRCSRPQTCSSSNESGALTDAAGSGGERTSCVTPTGTASERIRPDRPRSSPEIQ